MVSSIVTKSDGDLWPCAWGDDGFLYTANGDGKGFDLGSEWTDIVVNRISGDAMNLAGERLTGAEGVGGVLQTHKGITVSLPAWRALMEISISVFKI